MDKSTLKDLRCFITLSISDHISYVRTDIKYLDERVNTRIDALDQKLSTKIDKAKNLLDN